MTIDASMQFPYECHKETMLLCKFYSLTSATLNGGWMPETSKSINYWQPGPSCRPQLANPGNPPMSAHMHAEGKTGTRHMDFNTGKRKGKKGKQKPVQLVGLAGMTNSAFAGKSTSRISTRPLTNLLAVSLLQQMAMLPKQKHSATEKTFRQLHGLGKQL